MLSISQRPGKIAKIHSEPVIVNGERMSEFTIDLDGIELESAQLNQLLQDPRAWHKLFTDHEDPDIEHAPAFPLLKPLRLIGEVAEATVILGHTRNGVRHTMRLAPCSMKSIELAPQDGGLTSMSVKVVSHPTLDNKLLAMMDTADVEVEIHCAGYGDQQKLPLGNGKHAEQADREGARQ